MSPLPPLTKFARIAALAAVVGVSAFAALPAQARPFFSGPFPHRPFVHTFFQTYHYFPIYPQPYYPVYPQVCLPDWQVRRAVEDQGYYNVSLYSSVGVFAHGRASRGGRSYLITVNRCDGSIVSAQPTY